MKFSMLLTLCLESMRIASFRWFLNKLLGTDYSMCPFKGIFFAYLEKLYICPRIKSTTKMVSTKVSVNLLIEFILTRLH